MLIHVNKIKKFLRDSLSVTQKIVLSFILIILAGAILLSLPISSRTGEATPFIDALFTAVSASCVTGLVIYDTYVHWSFFGHAVILVLIQLGGLGLMGAIYMIGTVRNKKMGVKEIELLQESYSSPGPLGMRAFAKTILFGTLTFEAAGAVLLSFRFVPEFGFWRGICFSVFHSVSAFCNAGFDLMGFKGSGSLTSYTGDVYVNIVIMLLIIIGGLGFFVWTDVKKKKFRISKYSLHTKIVLSVTALLVFLPSLLFFFTEYFGGSFSSFSVGESVTASFFQSVTMRTAGFNSVDLSAMNDGSVLIMMFLMLIGGSPGSTAGGIKTTTFAVFCIAVPAVLKKREFPEAFGRSLDKDVMKKAAAILSVYIAMIITGTVIMCISGGVPLKEAAFEVVSAIATVGVSMGVTGSLNVLSKIVVILLMFFGRIGCLSMIAILGASYAQVSSKKPIENIVIG